MDDRTVGVVVAHGQLAAALVEAVEEISGVRGALTAVSNADCTPQELQRLVRQAVEDRPAVIFADMASGSCVFAGRRAAAALGSTAMVTGTSLPMLLDFVFHREMEAGELAERVAGKGRAATRALPPDGLGPDSGGGGSG